LNYVKSTFVLSGGLEFRDILLFSFELCEEIIEKLTTLERYTLRLAIFFWIMSEEAWDVASLVGEFITCYFLLNYVWCVSKTCNGASVWRLAIFFWIMYTWWKHGQETSCTKHLAIFFWIMFIRWIAKPQSRISLEHLLFSFELCTDLAE